MPFWNSRWERWLLDWMNCRGGMAMLLFTGVSWEAQSWSWDAGEETEEAVACMTPCKKNETTLDLYLTFFLISTPISILYLQNWDLFIQNKYFKLFSSIHSLSLRSISWAPSRYPEVLRVEDLPCLQMFWYTFTDSIHFTSGSKQINWHVNT